MNILHYTIGLPPERNGGSIEYARSLIELESKKHSVTVLVCGDTFNSGGPCRIVQNKQIEGLEIFEVTNPSVPSLMFGIKRPQDYYKKRRVDAENVMLFFKAHNFDIFHIHTLMGLSLEFLELVHELGVKIVYTTHDFFGICPKTNLLDYQQKLCAGPTGQRCAMCCHNSPSTLFMAISNSKLYRKLSWLRKYKGKAANYIQRNEETTKDIVATNSDQYDFLWEYYQKMFSLIDFFHFNSEQTANVFKSILNNINGRVVSITTKSIKDNRIGRACHEDCVVIGFIGSQRALKGLPVLKQILYNLYEKGYKKWSLQIWIPGLTGVDNVCPNITYRGKYGQSQLKEVYGEMDLLVVPSICYETFSLVTMEALSFGTNVMVSDTVGAKDIVGTIDPEFVFNIDDLEQKLQAILDSPHILDEFNNKLQEINFPYTMESHTESILQLYDGIITNDV